MGLPSDVSSIEISPCQGSFLQQSAAAKKQMAKDFRPAEF
jgi:hypothetical protein